MTYEPPVKRWWNARRKESGCNMKRWMWISSFLSQWLVKLLHFDKVNFYPLTCVLTAVITAHFMKWSPECVGMIWLTAHWKSRLQNSTLHTTLKRFIPLTYAMSWIQRYTIHRDTINNTARFPLPAKCKQLQTRHIGKTVIIILDISKRVVLTALKTYRVGNSIKQINVWVNFLQKTHKWLYYVIIQLTKTSIHSAWWQTPLLLCFFFSFIQ